MSSFKFNILTILIIAIIVQFIVSSGIVTIIKSLRDIERYGIEIFSVCPGSTKETNISNNNLKKIAFVHLDDANFLKIKKTSYNFFQMKQLAKKLDFRKKTVLYMTGYLDSATIYPFAAVLGSVYLKYGYNVILLEYSWFGSMLYPDSARYVRPVGRRSAEMLATLTTYGLDPKKLDIVGISLGAHGVSFIAKHYRHLTAVNISRITGLDPSGPCFRNLGPKDRIDVSDADFVDIIHTNIDGYGMVTPLGHVDYYINGGEFQVADISQIPCTHLCSHLKVYMLWISAIQHQEHFKAIKCDTIQDAKDRNCYDGKPMVTNLLGLKVDRNKTGIFYLATTYNYPYYLGDSGTKRGNDQYDPYA